MVRCEQTWSTHFPCSIRSTDSPTAATFPPAAQEVGVLFFWNQATPLPPTPPTPPTPYYSFLFIRSRASTQVCGTRTVCFLETLFAFKHLENLDELQSWRDNPVSERKYLFEPLLLV